MSAYAANPSFSEFIWSDRAWGIFLAISVHVVLFMAGNLGLAKRADFGMDFSEGAVDIDLLAAPAPMEQVASAAPTRTEAPSAPVAAQDQDDIAEPAKPPLAAPPPVSTPAPNALLRTDQLGEPLGDGSSHIAGKDATTLHHAGSGGTFAKPGYYRNPPPPYPEEARKLKQEGRVLLEASVTTEGIVSALRVKEGCGFPLLDQAALEAVKHWRFRPATIAGIKVDSIVEVPIRFKLQQP